MLLDPKAATCPSSKLKAWSAPQSASRSVAPVLSAASSSATRTAGGSFSDRRRAVARGID